MGGNKKPFLTLEGLNVENMGSYDYKI